MSDQLAMIQKLIQHGARELAGSFDEESNPSRLRQLVDQLRAHPDCAGALGRAEAEEAEHPLGMSMEVVVILLAAYGGWHEMTTSDVSSKYIKPMTLPLKGHSLAVILRAYELLFPSDGPPLVGPATLFVSHAWRYDFDVMVNALRDFVTETGQGGDGHKPLFFWFDLVTNDQHGTSKPFEWWCTRFRESVEQIGRTLIVCSPWHAPIPTTRCWCVYELFVSIDVGVPLEMYLPPEDQLAMLEACRQVNLPRFFFDGFRDLDLNNAEASHASDKERILQAAATVEGGIERLNQVVRRRLADLVIAQLDSLIKPEEPLPEDLQARARKIRERRGFTRLLRTLGEEFRFALLLQAVADAAASFPDGGLLFDETQRALTDWFQ